MRKKASARAGTATSARAQVQAYLAKLPPASRKRLTQMRSAIRAVAPKAVDHFSYGIPGFRLNDQTLVWYAAFKHHTSLFPMDARIRAANATALEGYKMATGTVQFPLAKPLPVALVKKLVKARVAAVRR